MSIEKDVEKKYIDELERKNKKLKKKKKRRLLLLLLLLLLLGGAGLLLGMFGLLPGFGDSSSGSDSGSSSSASSSAAETTTTTKAEPAIYVDIKVSGSSYIYEGSVKTLEEIKSTVTTMKENVVIRITDDNATKNSMDNLKNMLTDSKRSFETVETAAKTDSSSDADSSSEKPESESSSEDK